ncbi:MAG: hypothetical protein CAPSK01_001641 [Candidatus Accumulibacter vicinus]|uniref:Uncharacterized protein n=1 Tax=Candidatus Accumulibacter vicinus TaxID=2954382 RepID=A0A084Y242_9PROT|nr:MAG: hypothetical protein CAPSK01_001641 [Candidatus Accumulibacter vicinus]
MPTDSAYSFSRLSGSSPPPRVCSRAIRVSSSGRVARSRSSRRSLARLSLAAPSAACDALRRARSCAMCAYQASMKRSIWPRVKGSSSRSAKPASFQFWRW